MTTANTSLICGLSQFDNQGLDEVQPLLINTHELVIFDAGVDNLQQLINGIRPNIDWAVLNPNQDGIEQITRILANYSGIKTLHIVSHGAPGCLFIGNTQFNLDTLKQYTNYLQSWAVAEILLYGCNIAAGDPGEEFIQKLHQITKANIAASQTLTGNASGDGDWNLGYLAGEIEPELAFDEQTQTSYAGVLAEGKVTIAGNLKEDSTLTATVTDSNGISGTINYQWQSSTDGTTWTDIVGATSNTLTPGDDEVGKYLQVEVSYSDDSGNLESATAITENLTTPTLTSSYDTPGSANNVSIVGDYAYVADGSSGLQIIDVSDPANPTLTGSYNTPGNAWSVSIFGDYAYIADGGSGLQIINVSDPTNPTLTGSYDTLNNARSISIVGDRAYITDFYDGLQIIDISDPENPTLTGSYDPSSFALDVGIVGDYAYIANHRNGLQIIDISDPANPTVTATIDTPGYALGLSTVGDYAYVADEYSGLQIIDISNSTNPTLTGSYDTLGRANNVSIVGDRAYVADGGEGLQIIDISDPANPTLITSYETSAGSVSIVGDTGYITGNSLLQIIDLNNFAPAVVENINDKPSISDISFSINEDANDNTSVGTITGTDVDGDTLTYSITAGNEDGIFDIDSSTGEITIVDNRKLDHETTSSHNLTVQASDGNLTNTATATVNVENINEAHYITITGELTEDSILTATITDEDGISGTINYQWQSSTDGNTWTDITGATSNTFTPGDDEVGKYLQVEVSYTDDGGSPESTTVIAEKLVPTLAGSFDTPGNAFSVSIAGNYAFVADQFEGLQVINISDPTNPTLTTTYKTPGYALDVSTVGDYAFVADGVLGGSDGLQIIDISDPENPTLTGSYDLDSAESVSIAGNYAYVASEFSVQIIDISDPANPTLTGSYDNLLQANNLSIDGNYAYVANAEGGLEILDVSDPENPTSIGFYMTSGDAADVSVVGDYAFVASVESLNGSSGGLEIIDISNPANPTHIATYDTPGSSGRVSIVGDKAYIVDGFDGLQIIDISNPANPTHIATYDTPGGSGSVSIVGDTAYITDYSSGLQIVDINSNFVVKNINDAPEITSTAPTSATQDNVYTYTINTQDPDSDDTLTISPVTKPDWLTLTDNGDGTATLSGTPTNVEIGDHTIELKVEDGEGLSNTQSFTLTVDNANSAPTISGVPETSVDEDSRYSFIPTVTDIDGDALSFTITNKPNWAEFDSTTGELSGTPENDDVGITSNITISVTDGTETVELDSFDLTVNNVNDAPSAIALDNSSVEENADGAVIGNLTATDVDSSNFTYSVDDERFEVVNSQLKLKAGQILDAETESSITVNVTATDEGSLSIEQGFTVTVTDIEEPVDGSTESNISGNVSNSYIENAEVFLDANLNGIRDLNEPFALTEADGSFKFSINLEEYDLNQNNILDPVEGLIVAQGGIYVSSGLTLETPLRAIPGFEMVTPLTTLITQLVSQGIEPEAAEAQVKSLLGLPDSLELGNFNYLEAIRASTGYATANGDSNALRVYAAVVQVQNTIATFAKLFEDAAPNSSVSMGDVAIEAIVVQLQNDPSFDLSQSETLEGILQIAISSVSQLDGEINPVQFSQVSGIIVQAAVNINQLIEEAINSAGSLSEATTHITRIQKIALEDVAESLSQLVAGTQTIEAVMAKITVEAIQAKLAETIVSDPTDPTAISEPVEENSDETPQPTSEDELVEDNSEDTQQPTAEEESVEDNSEDTPQPTSEEESVEDNSEDTPQPTSEDELVEENSDETQQPTSEEESVEENSDETPQPAGDVSGFDNNSETDYSPSDQLADSVIGSNSLPSENSSSNDTPETSDFDSIDSIPEIVNPVPPAMPEITAAIAETADEPSMIFSDTDNKTYLLSGGDTLVAGESDDWINGNQGNDLMDAGGGNDTVYGGKDNDTVFGAAGNDWMNGNLGTDFLDGGEGMDSLYGGEDSDTLQGKTGNDWLSGNKGADFLDGGEGADTVFGGQDEDTLQGGSGNDELFGNVGADLMEGNEGDDLLHGGQNNDTLSGNNGDDTINGDRGNDLLDGNAGNDLLDGGEGNDTLDGSEGDDQLMGNVGDDILFGAAGNDTLAGGEGSDRFILTPDSGSNVITDFTDGEDLLVLEDSLTFEQLTIETSQNATIVKFNEEILATLNGVESGLITADDFSTTMV